MAVIAHVDLDAFYASVEQRDHPEWRGKPVIVGSRPDERGVVCTCSYEARKFGVHSAMPSRTAYARCPHGIFVRPRMEIYQAVSRQIFEIFSQFTPYVEGVSVDEAYLDISGSHHLFGGKENLVRQLRRRIFELAGITASVGVANNRLLAKLGSEDAKPDGMTIMPEGREEIIAFLAPRALKDLWGVGKKTSELLSSFGFHTCADVQQCEVQALERVLGSRMARQIREYAFGIASDEVVYERPDAKSISREHTFAEDTSERGDVRQVLLGLVDEVGMQLREVTRYAKVARVRIRDSEFSTATKQHQFASPARDDISLREMALRLFDEMWPNGVAKTIRLVGFGVDNLANDRRPDQGDFFAGVDVRDELLAKRERLSETIDRLRSKGYRV